MLFLATKLIGFRALTIITITIITVITIKTFTATAGVRLPAFLRGAA